MGWIKRNIEEKLKEKLVEDFGSLKGEEFYSHYVAARKKLVDNILKEIKAIENNLTDHSEDHIGDVMDKAYDLLGSEIDENMSSMELYFLCMTILFHDVGNIHGRDNHYEISVIHKIYNYVRNGDPLFNDERNLVCSAASAHSGKAPDGSTDTMKNLGGDDKGLFGIGVNLQRLAPVLRFADELAEGIQRTSDFMLVNHKYSKDSVIHHEYAKSTSVYVDRGSGRIVLTYTIDITCNKQGKIYKRDIQVIKQILGYCYKRIIKLNEERRYNKFYSNLLEPFNKTDVNFNFTLNGNYFDPDIGKLVITDLRVPGEKSKTVSEINERFKIPSLIEIIKDKTLKIYEND